MAQSIGNYGASFKDMNRHFKDVRSHYQLTKIKGLESVRDLFCRTSGVFIISVEMYREEDMEAAELGEWDTLPDDAKIEHYITYNAGTRLLQLYPEVGYRHSVLVLRAIGLPPPFPLNLTPSPPHLLPYFSACMQKHYFMLPVVLGLAQV